ncbi:unnamed protein product, partial [Rotaria sp. Silwood1]
MRQYLILADFLSGFKAREYSIYDQTGQHLQYRIESRYHILQTIELIAYPRKNVTGKLQAHINPFEYEADFEVYDDRKQKWSKGSIKQHWQIFGSNFTIKWNDHLLLMETKSLTSTTNIFDTENKYNLLARFQLRRKPFTWISKHDMEIYSNAIPDAVYLL